MRTRRTHYRLLSLFVFAFLCFNPGGLLCFAYCSQTVQAEHCPLQKTGVHCPHSSPAPASDKPSFAGSSDRCFLLPVGIFAAPLENIAPGIALAVMPGKIAATNLSPVRFVRSIQLSKFYYRPPPNDQRNDRIRNRVFRI